MSTLFVVPATLVPMLMLMLAAVAGLQLSAPVSTLAVRPGDIIDLFTILALAIELAKACRIDLRSAYSFGFAVLVGIGFGLLLFYWPTFRTVYAGKLAFAGIASMILTPFLRTVVARRDVYLSR